MNFSHPASTPKLKLLLPLIAGLLAIAAVALTAPAALAGGSGGVGVDGKSAEGGVPTAGQKAKYARLWSRVGSRDRRWARRTSKCESGRNPKAIGGGGAFRGAFQFMRSTWRHAPKSPGGDPIAYNYKTQAVVAVALKRREGRGHWPTCG